MRSYEMVLILDPELTEKKTEEALNKVEELFKKNKGKVEKIDKWGRRKLSYPIDGKSQGYYVLFEFKGEPKILPELGRTLKLTGEVIRHQTFLKARKELENGQS